MEPAPTPVTTVPPVRSSHKKIIIGSTVALLTVLIAGALLIVLSYFPAQQLVQSDESVMNDTNTVVIPPPRESDFASAQSDFQYLVSYSQLGFYPRSISMKVGEIVRFTNNSSSETEITGGSVSSGILVPGQHWQYTALTTGEQQFQDAMGNSVVISIE